MSKPQSVEWLLEEAVRRYTMFHKGEPLDKAWIGLGTTTEFRKALQANLMKPTFRNPGHNVWWTLTPKGVEIVQKMLKEREVAK